MRLLLTMMLALGGCPPKQGGASTPVTPTSEPSTAARMTSTTAEGLTQEKVDLNRDGKAEITNYFRERTDAPRLLMRKETDLNGDGKIDVRTTFDDGGQRTIEEMDGDFDGRADWVDHYIAGKRAYSEIDSDYNGSFDLFKYYENGQPRRKERDTNADGRIDFWEYLDENGTVVKTGRDVDGDGTMDTREQ